MDIWTTLGLTAAMVGLTGALVLCVKLRRRVEKLDRYLEYGVSAREEIRKDLDELRSKHNSLTMALGYKRVHHYVDRYEKVGGRMNEGMVAVGVGTAVACVLVGWLIIHVQAKRIEALADKELFLRREKNDRPGRPHVK